jgi:hypothetical protein
MALDVLKGLTPARKLGSGYNAGGANTYPIANGLAENIGEGDPVKLSAGVIQLATNTAACLGVFAGVRYIDSDGKLQIKKNFTTGTSSKGGADVGGGYTQPLAMVYDDPNQTYVVRTVAAASVSALLLGSSFKLSAIGSVVGGRSQAVLDVAASAGASGGHMVTIIGLYTGQDSEWGNAPTAVEVKLSNHGIVGEL